MCTPVMIKDIDQKGKGLVASKKFNIGDLIFKDKAVAILNNEKDSPTEILYQYNEMTSVEQSDFYNLTRGKEEEDQPKSDFDRHLSDLTSKFNNNAIFSGPNNQTGSLFLSYALTNHSCSPNSFLDLSYGKDTTAELRAIKNIEKGEEITITYIMLGYLSKEDRQKQLNKWGFICNCPSCTSGVEEEELIIATGKIENEIRKHISQIKSNKNKTNWAKLAQYQNEVVKNLQQLSFSSLLLPMEIADLICLAQVGRQQELVESAKKLLNEVIGQRKVAIYRKNYNEIQERLKTWKANLNSNLPPTDTEIDCFIGFRIDV